MNAIEVGVNGRIAMLKAVFGSQDAADPSTLPKLAPGSLKTLFQKA